MLISDVFRISLRSFKNNRARTLLTVLGISIGIGAIFFLISLGYGLQKLILGKIATSDSLLSLDIIQQSEELEELNQDSVKTISSIPDVKEVYPVVIQDTQISKGDLSSGAKVNIANPNFLKLEGITPAIGKIPEENEGNYVVLSKAVLQLLDVKDEDIPNTEITVNIRKGSEEDSSDFETKTYGIKGVTDNQTEAIVYVPESSVSNISFAAYDRIKVKVSSSRKVDEIRNQIIEKGFFVSAISDTVEQTKQIFSIIQVILALFGITALIVSAIGMFNTMTIALLERTQEIGIMKTIGASKHDVWKMFLAEAIIIGLSGGVFGLILGFILSRIANLTVNILAKAFGGSSVELFYMPFWFVAFIITFSTLVGLVTGLYPSLRAAKTNPLEALRYK